MNIDRFENALPLGFDEEYAQEIHSLERTGANYLVCGGISELPGGGWSLERGFGKTDTFSSVEDLIFAVSTIKVGGIYWVKEPVTVTGFDETEATMNYRYHSDKKEVKGFPVPDRFLNIDDPSKNPIAAQWILEKNVVLGGSIKEMARTFLRVTEAELEKVDSVGGGLGNRGRNPYSVTYRFEVV